MSIGTVKIIVTEPLASPLSGFATDAELLAVDGRVEDIEKSGYFRSGTIAGREAIPLDERKAGLRFFATDQGRDYEWRLAGDASGPKRDGAALSSDQWVGLYTPAEEKNLGIDFTGQLPIANVVGLSTSNAAIDNIAAIEIAGFRAEALSGDANPESELSWQIKGVQPTSQAIAWGASSIALGGDARSFRPKDWAAVKQLFVVGNSLSDSTDVTTRWSQVLAAALGVSLYSTARYSSDARQVYRTGAEPLLLTVSGGILPTGGTTAAVSHLNGLAPSNDASVNPASFLNTGSGDTGLTTGMSMAGTIVAGSVARHGTVSIPNGASTSYSIAQDAGGAAITLAGPVQFTPDISRQADKSDWVVWLGNNYFYSGVPNTYGDHTNPNMWVDLRKLVAKADGNRILMLPVLPATTMTLGGEVYNALLAANARTEAFFPFARARDAMGRTLLQRLQAEGDGSSNDNSDIANGWTPRSLRLSGDALHLNADGDAVVAAFVEEAFAAQTLPTAITQSTVFTLTATGTNPRTDAAISDVAVAQMSASSTYDAITAALSAAAGYPGVHITGMAASPSTAEIGSTVATVTVSWTLSTDPTAQTLNGVALADQVNDRSKAYSSVTTTTNYTLIATDADAPPGAINTTDTEATAITFLHRRYWGVSSSATLNSAGVVGLAGSELSSARAKSFSVAPSGQYVYYAYPTSLGDHSLYRLFGFDEVPVETTVSVTKANGATLDYTVLRSPLQLTATVAVEIQ